VAGFCEHGDEHSGYIKWSLACGAWSLLLGSSLASDVCSGNRKSRGGVGGMPAAWSGGPGFKFRLVDGPCRDLAWFISNSLQANSGVVPLKSQPSFPIHCTVML
jgi:hypothetical protein